LDSYVSIPALGASMKIKEDGTYSSTGISITPGTYTITAEINYYDYINIGNGNTPPPSGNKRKRTAKLTAANFKIKDGSNTLNFDFQLPVFLIHGIRDAYTTWDQWAEYLTKNGYIVFTPNHEFVFISKEAEARQIYDQYALNMNALFKSTFPGVNFICHSEGGVATRALVNNFPYVADKIKRIYTLGTPHSGTDFIGAGIYNLSKDQLLAFNEDYPNFYNVPVYAISGHGKLLSFNSNDCNEPDDGIVYWSSEIYRNCSPFYIKVQNKEDPLSYENTKGGDLGGYNDNGHHFGYWHSGLIQDGMNCVLICSIMRLMEGKTILNCNNCAYGKDTGQDSQTSESANFPVLKELFYLGANSSKSFQVNISSTESAMFTAFSDRMDIELSLTDPDGKAITSTNYSANPSIQYSKSDWGVQYSITTPKTGPWKVKVIAKNFNDYVAVGVYEKTTWTIEGASDKTKYYPNSQAILNAKIDGSPAGVNITTFQATTYDEKQIEISTIYLYDDGKHNDRSAGDGIYGNVYNTPTQEGYYRLKFHAESASKEQRESSWGYTVTGTISSNEITLSRTKLYFGSNGQSSTGAQTILIGNNGSGMLNWSASGNATWLSFTPSSGTGDSILSVSVNPIGLAVATYSGTISITDPNASNSPQTITVSLHVYDQGKTSTPFGDFATPREGSSVYSSIPVTGWVLDDIGVTDVKIYNGDTYIGDAVFVEGARPDVEAAYPAYPNNYKAGWGYMLLTNFLPNGGNGTYTLIAKATDVEGNQVTLGSKTITVDNAHAVKPFGAIDTPTQGGAASGKNFINWGWALTPQPNHIPIDGSTIDVYIDGVNKGHPEYNIYRSDIATLFPGYANSNGAVGYYTLDTTQLKNGIRTISWNVTDSAGNTDGIGSRYFSVMNTETNGNSSVLNETCLAQNAESSEVNQRLETVEELYPDEGGVNDIEIKELECVEINLSGERIFNSAPHPQSSRPENATSNNYKGYLVVGNQLRELPIGTTIDKDRGVFYWQPGPGFVGEYRFVFIGKNDEGRYTRKNIVVNIKPKD